MRYFNSSFFKMLFIFSFIIIMGIALLVMIGVFYDYDASEERGLYQEEKVALDTEDEKGFIVMI